MAVVGGRDDDNATGYDNCNNAGNYKDNDRGNSDNSKSNISERDNDGDRGTLMVIERQ